MGDLLMRLKQLEYVLEVAKCKSYSKAAKKLFISQPTISSAISSLEEELNVILFHRTPQGVFLTEDGENILLQIESILENIDSLANYSQTASDKHIITLAAVPAACNSLTIELMASLAEKHPNILVNLMELRPQKIMSALNNGLADIAIGSYTDFNKQQVLNDAKKNNFHTEPLLQDSLYVFLHRNHPKRMAKKISLEALKDERQAIFNDYLLLDCDCAASDEISFSKCYTFSDRSSIKQAVAAGLAYAVLPHQMVLDDIFYTAGLIKAIPTTDSSAKITTYLAWRNGAYTPSYITAVLDEIRLLYADVAKRLAKLETANPISEENKEHSILRY